MRCSAMLDRKFTLLSDCWGLYDSPFAYLYYYDLIFLGFCTRYFVLQITSGMQRRKTLHDVMELAAQFFQDTLASRNGAKAREVLITDLNNLEIFLQNLKS